MRKLIRTYLAAAAVAAAGVGLTAAPAHADATWTVVNGGSITASNTGNVIAENLTTGAVVTCTDSTANATVPNKAGGANPLGSVTGVTFATPANPDGWCDGPGGLFVHLIPENLPWTLEGTTYTAPETIGRLTGVKARLEADDGCVATITGPGGGTGTVDGKYNNSTANLTVLGGTSNNLEVATVNAFCDPLLINPGDKVKLDGTYHVNQSPAPQISSP
ncbi:hypothetical protein [Actinomadura sp. 3N508]|uniref:hypothetical protein n=1 Tax=Actinomadura sp. 3N508 TaxID=3375153 RepID=UPI0037B1AD80